MLENYFVKVLQFQNLYIFTLFKIKGETIKSKKT